KHTREATPGVLFAVRGGLQVTVRLQPTRFRTISTCDTPKLLSSGVRSNACASRRKIGFAGPIQPGWVPEIFSNVCHRYPVDSIRKPAPARRRRNSQCP